MMHPVAQHLTEKNRPIIKHILSIMAKMYKQVNILNLIIEVTLEGDSETLIHLSSQVYYC